jgi:hypothetical protein
VPFTDSLMPLLAGLALPLPEAAPATPPQQQQDEWQNAYQRLREQSERGFEGKEDEEPLALEPSLPSLPPLAPLPVVARKDAEPEVKAAAPLPETPTAERVRQLAGPAAEAQPIPRSWQVELPAAGPAWRLQVEQAQPQAPLNLELRVPPVAQSQARQQLADLDRRLRETGHDVLRTRLRTDDRRQMPVDEVQP